MTTHWILIPWYAWGYLKRLGEQNHLPWAAEHVRERLEIGILIVVVGILGNHVLHAMQPVTLPPSDEHLPAAHGS